MKRRTFLKSLAAASALPLLSTAMPRDAASEPNGAPKRVIYLFVPVGFHPSSILPDQQGALSALPSLPMALQPLKDNGMLDQCTLISDVNNGAAMFGKRERGLDAHKGHTVSCFNAGLLESDGQGWKCAESADQMFAKAQALSKSYQLGILSDPYQFSYGREQGISQSHNMAISWFDERTPLEIWTNQQKIFDELFMGLDPTNNPTPMGNPNRRWMEDRALLFAKNQHQKMSTKISTQDRIKFDQYINSLESLMRSLAETNNMMPPTAMCSAPNSPSGQTIDALKALDYRNYDQFVDDWMRIMVHALQCDKTRTIAFAFGKGASNMIFTAPVSGSKAIPYQTGVPGLPSVSDGRFHELSHYGGGGKDHYIPHLQHIDRWHVSKFASLVKALHSVPEGAGTMLDSTMVLMVPELSDTHLHRGDHLNILAAGAGLFKKGQHIKMPESNRELGSLHLTILRQLGVQVPNKFGMFGEGEVTEILA